MTIPIVNDTIHRLEIRGRVQGVGFRWALAEQANRLGVRGWVRNRLDGSVEAMVEGSAEALRQIEDWARRGPEAARVATVDVFPGAGRHQGFEQRPTA